MCRGCRRRSCRRRGRFRSEWSGRPGSVARGCRWSSTVRPPCLISSCVRCWSHFGLPSCTLHHDSLLSDFEQLSSLSWLGQHTNRALSRPSGRFNALATSPPRALLLRPGGRVCDQPVQRPVPPALRPRHRPARLRRRHHHAGLASWLRRPRRLQQHPAGLPLRRRRLRRLLMHRPEPLLAGGLRLRLRGRCPDRPAHKRPAGRVFSSRGGALRAGERATVTNRSSFVVTLGGFFNCRPVAENGGRSQQEPLFASTSDGVDERAYGGASLGGYPMDSAFLDQGSEQNFTVPSAEAASTNGSWDSSSSWVTGTISGFPDCMASWHQVTLAATDT